MRDAAPAGSPPSSPPFARRAQPREGQRAPPPQAVGNAAAGKGATAATAPTGRPRLTPAHTLGTVLVTRLRQMTNTADTTTAAPPSRDRDHAVRALLDAAERLLVSEGRGRISTRRVAQEAGVNHGLVHYYFGSMEELFVQVLERFTERLIARQRAMYAADIPFLEKWRTAWRFHEDDLAAGYPKIWWELQAMAWNHPEYRARVEKVHDAWRDAMRDAVREALSRYDLEDDVFTAEAWVTLIVTVNEGIILERLSGVTRGHKDLLAGIDRWLESLEKKARRAKR
jgi:AcrR family transcriptional regulator